eukprot:TRINITY_DN30752_c0_g1_i1.p1 TRINITY_DN30752_c0_g1~~TRINITY_DN30752_c0_g1_i1.p1  ORF type:complete len:347 (+),score=43.66 TRINITY_DN30752_c0_g1_i1:2-1042(+)
MLRRRFSKVCRPCTRIWARISWRPSTFFRPGSLLSSLTKRRMFLTFLLVALLSCLSRHVLSARIGYKKITPNGPDDPFVDVPFANQPETGAYGGGGGIGDLTGDGKPDFIFYKGHSQAMVFYELDEDGDFAPSTKTFTLPHLNSALIDIVDLNGDGLNDLVLTDFSQVKVRYFKNTGTLSNPSFTEQTGANNPMNSFTFASLPVVGTYVKQNGLINLIVSVYPANQLPRYFENTGTKTQPVFTERTGTTVGTVGFNPFNIGPIWGSRVYKDTTTMKIVDPDTGVLNTYAIQTSKPTDKFNLLFLVARENPDGSFTDITDTVENPFPKGYYGYYIGHLMPADIDCML